MKRMIMSIIMIIAASSSFLCGDHFPKYSHECREEVIGNVRLAFNDYIEFGTTKSEIRLIHEIHKMEWSDILVFIKEIKEDFPSNEAKERFYKVLEFAIEFEEPDHKLQEILRSRQWI
jgi:hypothetical protein